VDLIVIVHYALQARRMAHDVDLGSHKRERRGGCGFSKDVCKVVFTRDEAHD
jgi:hypothetical protein